MHRLAQKRVMKQEANEDLRMLAVMHAAFGATQSKKGVASYNKLARGLRAIANAIPIEEQNVKVNQRAVVGSLLKMGALLKKN